jgi:hypothetical protein
MKLVSLRSLTSIELGLGGSQPEADPPDCVAGPAFRDPVKRDWCAFGAESLALRKKAGLRFAGGKEKDGFTTSMYHPTKVTTMRSQSLQQIQGE